MFWSSVDASGWPGGWIIHAANKHLYQAAHYPRPDLPEKLSLVQRALVIFVVPVLLLLTLLQLRFFLLLLPLPSLHFFPRSQTTTGIRV